MTDLEQQSAKALAAHEAALAGVDPTGTAAAPVVEVPAAAPVVEVRGLVRHAVRIAPAAR